MTGGEFGDAGFQGAGACQPRRRGRVVCGGAETTAAPGVSSVSFDGPGEVRQRVLAAGMITASRCPACGSSGFSGVFFFGTERAADGTSFHRSRPFSPGIISHLGEQGKKMRGKFTVIPDWNSLTYRVGNGRRPVPRPYRRDPRAFPRSRTEETLLPAGRGNNGEGMCDRGQTATSLGTRELQRPEPSAFTSFTLRVRSVNILRNPTQVLHKSLRGRGAARHCRGQITASCPEQRRSLRHSSS